APRMIDAVQGLPDHLPHSTFRNISMPSFAVSPRDGSMVVVWADMRRGNADIYEANSTNGGATWSVPIRVNHDSPLDGKDQFQPEVAAAPNGTFYCSWFDRRWDPNNYLIDVAIAESSNDGASFGPNIRVTKHSWDPAIGAPVPDKGDTFIGDYQALVADNNGAQPLWNDTQNGTSQQIRTAFVTTAVFRAALRKR
ncbi:MAG TPA: sialidase family protein, partial [Acidobacteriaceae bacterium]|nr:sialidase family protein [Acidobacteriaceae bacterium]